jgi:hypothetical protein
MKIRIEKIHGSLNLYDILTWVKLFSCPIITKVILNYPLVDNFQNVIQWSCQSSNMTAATINKSCDKANIQSL